MGCASSKRIEANTGVYRPPPTSFAIFDINAIEEPWLKANDAQQQVDEKPAHVPALILEKLNAIEDAPRTWDEVSKALEDLKPTLQNSAATPKPAVKTSPVKPLADDSAVPEKQAPRKTPSFHTVEELDAKLSSKPTELRKAESMRTELKKTDSVKPEFKKSQSTKSKPDTRVAIAPPETEPRTGVVSGPVSDGYKPVRENIFIVRDRLERQKEGKAATIVKHPLSDYPEKCPPGGADSVVIYTTSLGGVRRTFEDCNRVRSILEYHRVAFDERDVSLHGEFLNEVRELLGEGASVLPRMFVKGRYVGGAEEIVSLNETGRLGRILNWAGVERGLGRLGCEGCGGARFVPCLECGGSRKILVGDEKEKCAECNENGLVHCPVCA